MEGARSVFCFVFLRSLVLLIVSFRPSMAATDEASVLVQFKRSSVDYDPRGSLQNWTAGGGAASSPCSWTGVVCSPADGRVRSLNLSYMGLVGRLRVEALMALSALRHLNLRGNSFYGNISYSSGGTSSSTCGLETVDLSANSFNGTVPPDFLVSCSRLASLNLSRNSIVGGIFPWGASLQELDLSRNQISDHGLLNYSLSGCGSLVYLNLSSNKLAGHLRVVSPSCTNLTVLDLSDNTISGEIPADFIAKSPPSLQLLDLSHNNFSGDLSNFDLGGCGGIVTLHLSNNGLNGTGLPRSLANCQQLETLDLSGNALGGSIPSFWSNFSRLKHLSLANNRFSGEIPAELGMLCGILAELNLAGNGLTGGLPSTFISCSSLHSLNLGDNQLSGDFVEKVVSTMRSLRYLRLAFNNISGPVPLSALANCSLLETIYLGSNELTGEVPADLCSSLANLQRLSLPNNYLSGSLLPPELGSCRNLRKIDLSFNELSGAVPWEVWSLPNLEDLVIWANNLSGEIPEGICSNSTTLQTLILSYNAITGSIPSSLTKCVNLVWVSLSGNRLTGSIPSGIGNLQRLAILQLGSNFLSGEIPSALGSCRNLIWLDLANNGLTGPVPSSLASQAGLIAPGIVSGKQFAFLRNAAGNICPGAGVLFEFQDIRPERLVLFSLAHSCSATRIYTGTTVYSFASNGSMIYLDLSYNSLAGTIPENFGSMSYLQVLNLGHNELSGRIPDSFNGLRMIMELDLSHNHLSGYIPGGLGGLTFLNDLDVSNNNLTGPIPTEGQLTTFPASRYENNSGLCGVPLSPCGVNAHNRDTHYASGERSRFFGGSVLIGVMLSALIMLLLMLALYKLRKQQKKEELRAGYVESLPTSGSTSWKLSGVLDPLSINVATFEKPLRKLTFAHLLEATNGFSADSLIGSGGFGEVYKARLKEGTVVAIKKLRHVTGQGDREFTAEMETIGKIKHRNLVPLLGYCKIGDERLLVYEYMEFGSLDVVLHDMANGSSKLDWPARKKIAVGSARGLAFLHHSCIPHIIHRDMKSSNVLIDENLEARVSDFGMARLVNALDTHLSVSTLAGTPGYVPPEYYQSFRCTTKGDVYSYGVVLLELLSGKKPIDPLEFGDNNLVGWAKQLVKENRSNEIFDPELLERKSGEAELFQYLKIACECLDDRPNQRPTMIQVMAMFKELQVDNTDSDFLDGFSIGQTIIDESKEKAGP